jgi:hypothetical protein
MITDKRPVALSRLNAPASPQIVRFRWTIVIVGPISNFIVFVTFWRTSPRKTCRKQFAIIVPRASAGKYVVKAARPLQRDPAVWIDLVNIAFAKKQEVPCCIYACYRFGERHLLKIQWVWPIGPLATERPI